MFLFFQRLQKMGHGVLRLATRKSKKEVPVKTHTASQQVSGNNLIPFLYI